MHPGLRKDDEHIGNDAIHIKTNLRWRDKEESVLGRTIDLLRNVNTHKMEEYHEGRV